MLTVAASSSAMFTVAMFGAPMDICGSPEEILVSVTITVSVLSTITSLITGTLMVALVLPAGMVTVPERAV